MTVANVWMLVVGCGCRSKPPTGLSEERHKIRHKANALGDCRLPSLIGWILIGTDREA